MYFTFGLLLSLLVSGFALPSAENKVNNEPNFDASPESRIVGGVVTAEGSAPFMVALSSGLMVRSLFCSGSLVTNRHVITAAHCVASVWSSGALSSTLRGTVGTNRWNLGGANYIFSHNVTHAQHDANNFKNNIAILVTNIPVEFGPRVSPVQILLGVVPDGVQARVFGWGSIRAGGSANSELNELSISTINGQYCADEMSKFATAASTAAPDVDPALELCTAPVQDYGVCRYDGGSPLVRESSGDLIGIVSWGVLCGRGAPDIYVKISNFIPWIQTVLMS